MSLPIRNLDDRAFQQIVDEAKRKIPELCPEWTNHNVSDPGVTLIELFAWMTEMSIFRLNQVPDVFYTRMLNLLGFQQFPTKAARTDLTFWLTSDKPQRVVVPAGTEVGTSGVLGDERVFSTLADVQITQPHLIAALTQEREGGSYLDVWNDDLRLGLRPVTCFPGERLRAGASFYLGFESSLAGNVISVAVTADIQGIGVVPDSPPVAWEVWNGQAWIAARVPKKDRHGQPADTTGGLNRNGNLLVLVPNQHERMSLSDIPAFWLRVRLTKDQSRTIVDGTGSLREAVYDRSPQLRSVEVSTVGGIALAEHSVRVRNEVLGTSTGKAGQVFQIRNRPVLPREQADEFAIAPSGDAMAPPAPMSATRARTATSSGNARIGSVVPARSLDPAEPDPAIAVGPLLADDPAREQIEVLVAGEPPEPWTEVKDFAGSAPTARHYVLDSTSGEVRFGPRIRNADGSVHAHGAAPADGARIRITSYRYGGGAAGNVGPGTLTALRETIPYVAAVTNLSAAEGGVDAERVEDAKARGPQWVRSGGRAVTASDFERVVQEADPGVARVRCVPPERPGDPVRILIVPKVEQLDRRLDIDDLDIPDRLFEEVRSHLDRRRILGSVVEIGTPYYQGISIAAVIAAEPGRMRDVMRIRVESELYRYIDPLTGGSDGTGWAFDADVNTATITSVIESIDGVKYVEDVLVFEHDVRRHQRLGAGKDLVRLEPLSLPLSGVHRVVVR